MRLGPISLPVTMVLDFWQYKAHAVGFHAIQGYVTAISHRHTRVDRKKILISHWEYVKTWVKGLNLMTGIPCVIVPPWNLEVMLSAL